MPARVFPNHHLVPDPHVLLGAHPDQLQTANLTRLGRHARRLRHRLRQPLGRIRACLRACGWKRKVAGRFQLSQRFQATVALLLAASVVEPELLAQEIGQLASMNELVDIQQPGDILNGCRL